MPKITLPAVVDSIDPATDFISEILENAGCPMRIQTQLVIALDELLSNVARYAYPQGEGDVTVSLEILEGPRRAVMTVTDKGVPYNPLEKEDPDVTLPSEKRGIGGLGIYIVKKSMDDMTYAYEGGKNIVSIFKKI